MTVLLPRKVIITVGLIQAVTLIGGIQRALAAPCQLPADPRGFLQELRGRPEGSAVNQADIDELLCLATTDAPDGKRYREAIYGLFHFAATDDERRRFMLTIAMSEPRDATVTAIATRLLCYLPDDDTAKFLFDRLQTQWEGDSWSLYLTPLIAWRYPPIYEWLEVKGTSKEIPEPWRRLFAGLLEEARMQRSLESTLACLSDPGCKWVDHWLVRHAIRLGASKEQIRQALFVLLERMDAGEERLATVSSFVKECVRLGIVSAEDYSRHAAIREQSETGSASERAPDVWTETVNGKMAQFYRTPDWTADRSK